MDFKLCYDGVPYEQAAAEQPAPDNATLNVHLNELDRFEVSGDWGCSWLKLPLSASEARTLIKALLPLARVDAPVSSVEDELYQLINSVLAEDSPHERDIVNLERARAIVASRILNVLSDSDHTEVN